MIKETKPVVIDGKTTYDVPSNLEFIRKVGSGAYGTVASFKDPISGMLHHPKQYKVT
jgi:mitogen-activated protein kinase 1/3